MHNQLTGSKGEHVAAEYLLSRGFTLLERNARSRWGEIDIVGEKDGKIYFFEVKTRTSSFRGKPYDNVHALKVRKLSRAIQYYILMHRLQNRKYQCDVIAIEFELDHPPIIKRYENIEVAVL